MALTVKLRYPALEYRPFTPADAEALVGKPFEFDGCPGTVLEAFCMKAGDALHLTVEYERRPAPGWGNR